MANCVCVMAIMRHLCISSPYLAIANKHGKRHAMRAMFLAELEMMILYHVHI